MAVHWPLARPTIHLHHSRTNAKFWVVCGEVFLAWKRMASCLLWSINNLEGSQLRTKRNLLEIYYCNEIGRLSDSVRGCGAPQFGQICTITHNLRKFTKSHTIRKFLLEILIKRVFLLSIKISRIFFDHYQTIYLRMHYPNNKAFLDIHDLLRGLLGLMGRSPQVFSFIALLIASTNKEMV